MRNQRTTHAAFDSKPRQLWRPDSDCACPTKLHSTKPRVSRYIAYLGVAGAFTTAIFSYPFAVRAAQDAAGSTQAAIDPRLAELPPVSPNVDNSIPASSTMVNIVDGAKAQQTVAVCGRTVGDAVNSLDLNLGALDRVTPSSNSLLLPGERIVIKRVRVQDESVKGPLPYQTIFKMSHNLAPGLIQAGHPGKPGVIQKTYAITYVNEKPASRKLVTSKVLVAAVDDVTYAGIRTRLARALPSRSGAYRRLRCLSMLATGYSPYEGSSTGRCATGMRAGYGVVAVDPRVISLGTRLYIEGYGYAVAGDTGGAIKGHRIDLGHTTYSEASAVGRQRVKVWILDSDR